jgi:hypothetical protein
MAKAATVALQTLIKNGSEVRATPKLIAEWEHNRYSTPTVTVVPDQTNTDQDWLDTYDVNSIALPNRPRTGIAKARFSPKLRSSAPYRDQPASSRFYASTPVDPYKYFSSIQKTGTVAGSGGSGYPFTTPIEVTVMYPEEVIANKITVGFETSYSFPKTYTVEVSYDGVNWSTASASSVLDSNGRVDLWFNGANWTTIADYDNARVVRGVKVVVYTLNDQSEHVDILQLGAKLENDLSDFIQSYSKGFEVSDRSFIAPMGRASSNEAKVTLDNDDGRFNNENEDSIYFGLIGKKTKFTLDLSFDATDFGGSPDERLREFTMWVDNWGSPDDTSIEVDLKDSSIFLQEISVPKVFWEGSTSGAIIWEIMDIVGMANYAYTRSVLDTGQAITYFWPEQDSDTAWDLIGTISEGTQTAVFFDEYDIMQIRTRKSLFQPDKVVDWNLDAIQNGQKLPDIIDSKVDISLVANEVNIKYKPAHYSDFNNGLPKMEVVWQPEEETVALRASPLVRNLLVAGTELWINQVDAAVWQFESDVNIRGEILHYKGKEYAYNKVGGGIAYEMTYSQDDVVRLDTASDPNMKWANQFTGKFAITQRGLSGSGTSNHYIRPNGYTSIITNMYNTLFYQTNNSLMKFANGTLSLVDPGLGGGDILLVTPAAVISSAGTTYGTKLMFPDPQPRADQWATAGLRIAGDWGDTGYYIEIATTETIELEQRAYRNEICLNVMNVNAPQYRVDKGITASIVKGVPYAIDVRHTVGFGGVAAISVFLNGVEVGAWTIAAAARPHDEGKFGVYTRGNCNVQVEYLYAVNQADANSPDQSTFLDLVTGGYTSGYIERDWKYGGKFITSNISAPHEGNHVVIQPNYRAQYFYDEFGPVVHEIRQFTVAFDDTMIPVIHSFPYMSNDTQVVCTQYYADPFGATFTLANASRQTAIINGQDDLTFGPENSIQQKLMVYGRALYQDADQTVTKKDDFSIRRNGTVSLDFDNIYIQTAANADDLAQWIIDEWGGGSEEVNMNIFGNPLIQLGDLATVNYPVKGMFPSTHKYYIVSIANEYDQGLSTTLILRRARI